MRIQQKRFCQNSKINRRDWIENHTFWVKRTQWQCLWSLQHRNDSPRDLFLARKFPNLPKWFQFGVTSTKNQISIKQVQLFFGEHSQSDVGDNSNRKDKMWGYYESIGTPREFHPFPTANIFQIRFEVFELDCCIQPTIEFYDDVFCESEGEQKSEQIGTFQKLFSISAPNEK